MTRKEYEKAKEYFQAGLETLETAFEDLSLRSHREWQAVLMGNLGILAGREGNYAKACSMLEKIQSDLIDQADHAEVYTVLAYYRFKQGQAESAYELRQKAEQILQRLGISAPICEEDRLWRELQPLLSVK